MLERDGPVKSKPRIPPNERPRDLPIPTPYFYDSINYESRAYRGVRAGEMVCEQPDRPTPVEEATEAMLDITEDTEGHLFYRRYALPTGSRIRESTYSPNVVEWPPYDEEHWFQVGCTCQRCRRIRRNIGIDE